MIEESIQEYASLYVFGLLDGLELEAFKLQLSRDAELRDFVQQLSQASALLAYAAPDVGPPAELKARILARIGGGKAFSSPAPAAAAPSSTITAAVAPPFPPVPRAPAAAASPAPVRPERKSETHYNEERLPRSAADIIRTQPRPPWFPLALAAGLAIGCTWLGQLYLASRTEALALRDQQVLTEYELKSARNQLVAERLIAKQESGTDAAQRAIVDEALKASERNAREARDQLLAVQGRLNQATQQIALLETRLTADADLANFKISTLASLLGNSPQALAVAVWNPARQEGVLRVEKLPALAANEDYQLWLVDPQYSTPVNGGVFEVDPATGEARVNFKASKHIDAVAKFAVSRERKGGAPQAEGPMVLLSQ